MTDARWRRAEQLYHAALARVESERTAFLRDACAGDDGLRREVESLLESETEGFLRQSPALEFSVSAGGGDPVRSLVGRQIGGYQVLSLVGAGGMGEVYRAHDTTLGRDIALKVLPAMFTTDAGRLARFKREARMLATLNHPNIAAIYGFEDGDVSTGTGHAVHALVLELVEGQTLAEKLAVDSRAMPLTGLGIDQTLDVARQIADALDAAHERGIVHRDLKPANIKITPEGRVKVLDFGLAKAVRAGEAMSVGSTREGMILGTPAYMSPEQARGKTVDKRTDVWAFGCVVYEMLTGRAAFARETVSDTIAMILDGEPDWNTLPDGTPVGIRRLLQRCLVKDVTRRLRDIGDARMELDETLSRSQPASAGVVRAAFRKRAVAVVSAVLVVSTVGVLIVLWMRAPARTSADSATSKVIATQLTNYGGAETSGALSPDGRVFAFVSDHGGNPDIWLRQVAGGEPVRLTDDVALEQDLVFGRDGEQIFFTRQEPGGESIWQTGLFGGQQRKVIANARGVAPSPDGRSLAYVVRDPEDAGTSAVAIAVSALDGSGRRLLARQIPQFPPVRPAWSHDGRSLSYVRAGLFAPQNLFVVDVSSGRERQVTHFTRPLEGVGQHVWLPGDRHLAVAYRAYSRAQGNHDLAVLDVQDASLSRVTTVISENFNSPSVSSDGSRLLATSNSSLREVWKIPVDSSVNEADGRAGIRLLDNTQEAMWTFVSRDAQTLLFNGTASGSRNLWTMPLNNSAKARQITAVPGDGIGHSSLSPDGTRVVFVSFASGTSDIWVQDVDGSNLRQLTEDPAADSWPVWSPDGKRIVFTSAVAGKQETRVMSADGSGNERLIEGFFRGDWIRNPAGDGTLIVTSLDGAVSGVRLIDPERKRVIWEQRLPGMAFSLPVFSPDGQLISAPFADGPDRSAIQVLETSTGRGRVVARLPFIVLFRASWVDGGKAFIVDRFENISHIVLFDRFGRH